MQVDLVGQVSPGQAQKLNIKLDRNEVHLAGFKVRFFGLRMVFDRLLNAGKNSNDIQNPKNSDNLRLVHGAIAGRLCWHTNAAVLRGEHAWFALVSQVRLEQ